MSNDLKPGDEVRLKSGGPIMTIAKIFSTDEGSKAQCEWFDNNQKPQKQSFHLHSLESYDGAGGAFSVG